MSDRVTCARILRDRSYVERARAGIASAIVGLFAAAAAYILGMSVS